ncbi:MAG: M23 family metallopeptidase [Blastocatellia bacterium]
MDYKKISRNFSLKLFFVIVCVATLAISLQPITNSSMVSARAVASRGFQFPIGAPRTGSVVNQHFGSGWDAAHKGHLGTDFKGTEGTDVFLAADAKITYSGYDGASWGNVIIAEHDTKSWGWDKTVWSMYAHIKPEPIVKVGAMLPRGTKIAKVGPKALGSTAPHLHFEIRSGTAAWWRSGPGYSGFTFNYSPLYGSAINSKWSNLVWYNAYQTVFNNLY